VINFGIHNKPSYSCEVTMAAVWYLERTESYHNASSSACGWERVIQSS